MKFIILLLLVLVSSFAFAGRPVFHSPTRTEIIAKSEWIVVVKNLVVNQKKLECGWEVTKYQVNIVEILKAGKIQNGLKPGDSIDFNPHPSSAEDCALRKFNKSGASFSASRYQTKLNFEIMKSKDEFIVFLNQKENGWSLPADNAFETLDQKEEILISTKAVNNTDGQMNFKKALVDFDAYKILVAEVEKHRADRLISLDVFLKMSKEKNVVIFDSRSDSRFNRKHFKGAIHLDFTDFTQENLAKLLPDPKVKILIYCNNNFEGDQVDFATKVALPNFGLETQILSNRKPIMLALNIPTYLNLYGYGYRNIYELNELVSVNDKRIKFEGTVVK